MNVSKDQIEKLLRKTGQPVLSPEIRERIKRVLLVAFSDVTREPSRRYIHQETTSYHLSPIGMASIIIAVILIITGAGVAIASDSAKPGDALYGVDQALEQTRLNFTLNDTAKAEYLAKLAQEREKELTQLEAEGNVEETSAADEQVGKALDTATQTLERVRTEQEDKGNEHAAETLSNVEDKLSELQQRHEERTQQRIQIEVKISNGTAKVEIRGGGVESTFTLTTDDVNQIVAQIVQRTGLTESDVRAALKLEYENQNEEQGDTNTNENENKSANENENKNENRNANLNADTSSSLNANEDTHDSQSVNENRNTNKDKANDQTDSSNESDN